MLVSQILKLKAESGVMTIAPDATVAKAVEMLASRRIGEPICFPVPGRSPINGATEAGSRKAKPGAGWRTSIRSWPKSIVWCS